tara:strand:- start:14372 stop:15337 length:966 start_codon:yes stop_codon:yes gene_type:complete
MTILSKLEKNFDLFKIKVKKEIKGKVEFSHSLAKYTSWRVGGDGDIVFWPDDLADLQKFLAILNYDLVDIPISFLGLGSNVLIRDGGIRGVVIITQGLLNNLILADEKYIYAEAGVPCAKVSKFMASNGFTKGEFLSGIPGTVGGALAMNAGAYKGETWDFVAKVQMINKQGQLIFKDSHEFEISYRTVKHKSIEQEWFVAAWFAFDKGVKEESLARIKNLLKSRNESQPIGKFSGGSVFRNPKDNYAAKIIENLGLKNYSIGGAQVSEKHANFIINDKTATAKDIESLIFYVKDMVFKEYNINLEPEVHFLGDYLYNEQI